jgi:hypothetical protein
MRKTIVLMALGLFLSASAANACDGDKAVAKKAKAAKAATKAECAVAEKAGKCDTKSTMATGKHDCCKKGGEVKQEAAKATKAEVKS